MDSRSFNGDSFSDLRALFARAQLDVEARRLVREHLSSRMLLLARQFVANNPQGNSGRTGTWGVEQLEAVACETLSVLLEMPRQELWNRLLTGTAWDAIEAYLYTLIAFEARRLENPTNESDPQGMAGPVAQRAAITPTQMKRVFIAIRLDLRGFDETATEIGIPFDDVRGVYWSAVEHFARLNSGIPF